MPRLGEIDRARLTERQRQVADEIQSGPRGGLAGPFWPWLRSPGWLSAERRTGVWGSLPVWRLAVRQPPGCRLT